MRDDLELANLLGETPSEAPDPAFRFEVFARVTRRARRRASLERGLNRVAIFAAIGLVFPLAQAAGLSWRSVQPLLMVTAVFAAAAVAAVLTIQGPRGLLAQSRAMLRAPLLRV